MVPTKLKWTWGELWGLLACYIAVLAGNGYVFGAGDQVEVLPYALHLGDPSLYPADFYVQYISRAIPNERYFFSWFLSLTDKALPFFCGLFHCLGSLFLLAAWYRIGQLFLQSEAFKWGLLLLLFLPPIYGINLGGNELYYNTFIPSLLAKSIGSWALYFFLQQRWEKAVFFLALSTFIHPVAGAQLFLILGGVLLIEKGSGSSALSWPKLMGLAGTYLLTAGIWVAFLKLNFDQGSIDPALLFEIMEFRVPHHYFPSHFPIKNYLLLALMFAAASFFYFSKRKSLFWFFVLALFGCILYAGAVELLQSPSLLTAQWFKSTIWLKALAFIAILAGIESYLPFLQTLLFRKITYTGLGFLGLFGILVMAFPFSIFQNRSYDFFFSSAKSEAIAIAQQAEALSPVDAVFIIPINQTSFKYHSQRSCYIDYKTVVHRKDALLVWYDRIREVYGIDGTPQSAEESSNRMQVAEKNYDQKTEKDWRQFKSKGVHYLLMPKERELDFPILTANQAFRIYRIE